MSKSDNWQQYVGRHWDIQACHIHGTGDILVLVDHALQSTVMSGTRDEIFQFIQPYATRADKLHLFGLDYDENSDSLCSDP